MVVTSESWSFAVNILSEEYYSMLFAVFTISMNTFPPWSLLRSAQHRARFAYLFSNEYIFYLLVRFAWSRFILERAWRRKFSSYMHHHTISKRKATSTLIELFHLSSTQFQSFMINPVVFLWNKWPVFIGNGSTAKSTRCEISYSSFFSFYRFQQYFTTLISRTTASAQNAKPPRMYANNFLYL